MEVAGIAIYLALGVCHLIVVEEWLGPGSPELDGAAFAVFAMFAILFWPVFLVYLAWAFLFGDEGR